MATPSVPETTSPATTPPSTETTKLYELIASYDFWSDLEFRKGLGTILGHPETPASDSEVLNEDYVVLQAKCFYISRRKNVSPPIDATSYQHWLKETNNMSAKVSHGATGNNNNQHTKETRSPSSSTPNPDLKDAEPAYPSSFSHIVELITTGQPIPGIEDIPDTVLSGHEKPSTAERRRKPWEKAEEGSTS